VPPPIEPRNDGDAGIASSVVAAVVTALAGLGFDAGDQLRLSSDDTIVPGALADRCLDDAATRLRDDAIGLTVAQRIPIGGLGVLDYALSTSSTLGDALRRVSRHYGIATQRVKLTLLVEPTGAALAFERSADVASTRHWLEFSFAVFVERMRQTIDGAIRFGEVTFRHDAPRSTAAHDAYFGTAVRFSAPHDRLGFPLGALGAPLRTASAMLASLLDTKMSEIEARATDSFIENVRGVMSALLNERDTRLESAAARLHTSRRTLQRELHIRGTSHKEVLEVLRRERALALLKSTSSVAEVAARLGYADPSAFFRAFRRWTGTSPRAAPVSSGGDDGRGS
jgi:AraC-like DNA-binding protein